MKRLLVIMVIVAGLVGTANAGVRQREARQQARIAQGVRNGSLTRGEARRLQRQERALHRQIVSGRISGGRLSSAQRAQIRQQQKQLGGEIRRLKHNGRVQ